MEKKFLFLGFLLIVLSVNSFSQSYLNISWDNKTHDFETSEYDLQAKKLVNMFIDNFVKFESDVEEKIINSGPSQI